MTASSPVAVISLNADYIQLAQQMAARLGVPVADTATEDYPLLLCVGAEGLSLQATGPDAPGAVRVDFVEGAMAHRRQFGGGAGQMVAKACGLRGALRPTILDATAGLGRDAFVLASLGCQVTLIERQPVIAALLADGLERARQAGGEVAEIATRMRLLDGDAIELMRAWQGPVPQVVHLDPMFPQRDKSALVKKEMRLFKPLVGEDADAPQLLAAALELASHRVAVKRPRKAPAILGTPPSAELGGQSSRYDIYGKQRLS
ncbi:MAG: class I SAM-dependent methyltransferase [Pseudomonas sp.]